MAPAAAGSPPSTACCRARRRRARARGRARQAVGPHHGDPAAHRPQPARRRRPRHHRRAHDRRRLRRPAGRRRHAHGEHHRRLRRRLSGRRGHQGPARPARAAPVRLHRGGLRRDRGRRDAARPGLRGGLVGRGRPQRGDHRRRPPRRGAGDRRGRAVLAAGARGDARPGRGEARPPWRRRRPAAVAELGVYGTPMRFVLATGNRHKAREFGAILAPCRVEVMPAGVELPPEGVDSFADNALGKAEGLARAVEGDPALLEELGLRPGEDVLFLADDSGLEVEALGWAPGVTSARYAGVDGPGADAPTLAPPARTGRLCRPRRPPGALRLLGCRRRAGHDTLRRNGILVGRRR